MKQVAKTSGSKAAQIYDPVRLEIYKHLLHSVAEEMGAALRRTAFSPNIKERRDYSCAVFDAAGDAAAMGDHMPVHLGSMPMSVAAVIKALALADGDIAVVNDPFAGGTHLPDITMVMPVFTDTEKRRKATFYVAARAHHADVGGAFAGSMGTAHEIFQEGLRIPPVKIMERGEWVHGVRHLLLANVRTPEERDGDLAAQVAACRTGARRLREIAARYGAAEMSVYMRHLNNYAALMMQSALAKIPEGTYSAEDFLDDDGVTSEPVRVAVRVTISRKGGPKGSGAAVRVDFSGSSPQCAGSINGVFAIAYSAVFYVFRCLLPDEVPACAGLMRNIEVIAPPGSVVNAQPPAAVAGGNVELSQRIVDVLLRALADALPGVIPAASSGTMNNLTIGCIDPRTGQPCAYYETVAGGMGARPGSDGVSGVHTHMTNSLNTPVEALEMFYPFRVRRYGLRKGSGGRAKYRGGDGIVREIEMLAESDVTILSDRRRRGPYGLAGGDAGKPGRNTVLTAEGEREISGKISLRLRKGEAIRIETPGAGGWGIDARGDTEGNEKS
jgi:N-methylhydantoinase B